MLFGYIPDKGFLSLRGIVTMAAFVMLGIYGYVTVKNGKIKQSHRISQPDHTVS